MPANRSPTASGPAGGERRAMRAELRARLAAERAELWCALLGIERDVLEKWPVLGDASAAGCLHTVAAREDEYAAMIEGSLAGGSLQRTTAPAEGGSARGFDLELERCVGARTRFLDAFARVAGEGLDAPTSGATTETTPWSMAVQCSWNDSALSMRLSAWSRRAHLGESFGPPSLLRAAARAARKELLTTVPLVPEEVRELPAFEGGRTLSDIFHLISRLERSFLQALTRAGYQVPTTRRVVHATGDGTWQSAWDDLHATHTAEIAALDALPETAFAREIADADANYDSIYTWARGCLLHDRLHAASIRATLELDWPERLLR